MIIKRNSMRNDIIFLLICIASDLSSPMTFDKGRHQTMEAGQADGSANFDSCVVVSPVIVPLLHLITHYRSISMGMLWYHIDFGKLLAFWWRTRQDARASSRGSMELCIYLYLVIQIKIFFSRRFSFLFLLYVQQYSEKKETFDSHD